ncbi:MAG: restriction endonuclease [Opitutaceae bacterium]|nr:restriction endonuclease [Opitutaceae bacterium]
MRSSFAPIRTVIGVAAGLLFASLPAAESPHPLVGATRDQVLSRYGEPKGQISVGPRTVLTYAHEKLVLRNGVVVEVERLSAEPLRRPAPAEAAASEAASPPATGARPSVQPHVGTENPPTPAAAPSDSAAESAPAAALPPGSRTAPLSPEPKLAIKLVRPPGAGGAPAPRPMPAPVVEAPPPANEVPEPEPALLPPPGPDPKLEAEKAEKAARAAQAAAEAAAQEKRLKSAQSARRRLDFAESAQEEEGGLGKSTIIGILVLVAGIGGLAWWRRQQSLALAATSVASTPVKKSAAAPAASGSKVTPFPAAAPVAAKPAFTVEFLAQLDAGRFEELVAAYFVRTGVVATRANSGTGSPVHLRLSWKGEPRAFACAHCIAQGPDDLDARALQPFADALAAENLRRGYVVTSGAFSSSAVKFAASKQIILLPADTLLEKIKGLPESARAELMQVLTAEKKAA